MLWFMYAVFLLTDLWTTRFKSQLRKGKLGIGCLTGNDWQAIL